MVGRTAMTLEVLSMGFLGLSVREVEVSQHLQASKTSLAENQLIDAGQCWLQLEWKSVKTHGGDRLDCQSQQTGHCDQNAEV